MGTTTPRTVASFEIERELARGGMGIVYLARQPALDRCVVLKTLRRELADDKRLAERFRREAQAAAAVHHENVVAVYDGFSWRGRSYIAQEYVDGEDLETALGRTGPLAPRIAAWIALEVARGLEAIHARGVVHRDLKPSNVLIAKTGEVKIADFGIAWGGSDKQLTQTGHAVGTPRYMSPEQLYGERVDPRSDVFALGIVLYEMLTGRAPFVEEAPDDESEGEPLLRRIESGNYTSVRRGAPGTPRALARLVRRCLRARPKKRPASATELRLELEHWLGNRIEEGRREVSDWLWEREVFQREAHETAAEPSQTRPRRRTASVLRWAVASALTAAAMGASTWVLAQGAAELPVLADAFAPWVQGPPPPQSPLTPDP